MTPAPYEQFEREAAAAAKARYRKTLLPLVIGGAIAGAVIGVVLASQVAVLAALVGAAVGSLAGLLIYYVIVKSKAINEAEAAYTQAWCAEHGFRVLGECKVPNGPHADSGHDPIWSDAVEGTAGGPETRFYNFSYLTTSTTGKTPSEVEHPFKIVRISGTRLPIMSLSFAQRGKLGAIGLFDDLDSAFTKQRVIELESIDFNEKFKLEVDDDADEIWIRRVFDPTTIDALVTGKMQFPDIRYCGECFWLVKPKHYKVRELDEMLAWQSEAAVAVAQLARVPNV